LSTDQFSNKKVSAAGLLITLGIIYGDIGTSPLYVVQAIIGDNSISPDLIMGGMSCIFWTLMIITTFKYVYLALSVDNKGEGGVFALFARVRHHKATWPLIAALIGCSALIADGFITPPISISSAIEGLKLIYPDLPTLPIVLTILVFLFIFQQFGTSIVGKTFGPVMLIWFIMIAFLGIRQIIQYPAILEAVNPKYALHLLTEHKNGFWVLGAVFLCTTGGEALYADLGHCGKKNIRISWTLVLACLLLCYMGQCAWVLQHQTASLQGISIFYSMAPDKYLPLVIAIATAATVIASQAMISGCFTLVSEAIKQRLWINMRVNYPADYKGQIYIPAMNWVLFSGCIAVLFIFQNARNMEGAYGLAITIDMLMTTSLLLLFFRLKKAPVVLIAGLGVLFFTMELAFLFSNMKKFFYGGWFTFFVGTLIFFLLMCLHKAREIRDGYNKMVDLKEFKPMFEALINDESIPREATNLVYMSKKSKQDNQVDSNIIYSIFQMRPKRAAVYWFVHVDILDYPYEHEKSYTVKTIIPGKVFFVRLEFGFKVKHKVNRLFRKVVEEMQQNGEVDEGSRYSSMRGYNIPADFKFVFIKPVLSDDNDLKPRKRMVMAVYEYLSALSLPPFKDFGLDTVNVEEEVVPIHIELPDELLMVRKQEE